MAESRPARRKYLASPRGRFVVLKSVAKRLKRDLTITFEEYCELTVGKRCHYCGGELRGGGYKLDRQNNAVGYVHGNLVPCCCSCNRAKGGLEMIGFTYPRTVELMLELGPRRYDVPLNYEY